jgi:hypothetical protein
MGSVLKAAKNPAPDGRALILDVERNPIVQLINVEYGSAGERNND